MFLLPATVCEQNAVVAESVRTVQPDARTVDAVQLWSANRQWWTHLEEPELHASEIPADLSPTKLQ